MHQIHDLRGLDLNLLVVFQALLDAGSVTGAATTLGLTQSATSHALRRLRDATDDPLFVRQGRTLAATPRAEAMAPAVGRALAELHRALWAPVAFDAATTERTFHLASVDLFDLALLPGLLHRLRDDAPRAALTVRPLHEGVVEALHQGSLDAAVIPVLPDLDPGPLPGGLVRRTLFREGFVTCFRTGHPAPPTDRTAYLDAQHLLVSPDGGGRAVVDEALAGIDATRRIALRLPRFAAALGLVAASDLVLTAPATLGRLAPPGVTVVAPPFALPDHAITLVWSERFHADPGHRWLREQVVGACARR